MDFLRRIPTFVLVKMKIWLVSLMRKRVMLFKLTVQYLVKVELSFHTSSLKTSGTLFIPTLHFSFLE